MFDITKSNYLIVFNLCGYIGGGSTLLPPNGCELLEERSGKGLVMEMRSGISIGHRTEGRSK